MATKENDELVEVYAGSFWEAELVKGHLDANNIDCMLKDESLSSVTAPGVGGDVKVLVREEDSLLAKRLVDKRKKEE